MAQDPHRPYVLFAGEDWWHHSHAHADLQIMIQVARVRPVLIVNTLGMRPVVGAHQPDHSWRHTVCRIARRVSTMRPWAVRPAPEDVPDLWVLAPVVLPWFGSSWRGRAGAALVAAQTRRAVRKLGTMRRPAVAVANPVAWPVVRRMGLGSVLAYRIDHHSATPGVDRRQVERLEDELFEAADLVAYSSSTLLAAEWARHGGVARHLDHGVDAVRFDPARPGLDEPPDLAGIPHPRLGLVGSLEAATKDVGLLEAIATALPEVSVVVVGADPDAAPALAALPNVWMLGRRPHASIPRYLRHLDAGLVLVPDHEWGRGSNPIKLKEYLAMGIAVVSTEFPELERYRNVVAVGAAADALVDAVRTVLGVGDPVRRQDDVGARARRRAVGAARTWQDQAELLLRWWDDGDAADDLAALGPLEAIV